MSHSVAHTALCHQASSLGASAELSWDPKSTQHELSCDMKPTQRGPWAQGTMTSVSFCPLCFALVGGVLPPAFASPSAVDPRRCFQASAWLQAAVVQGSVCEQGAFVSS